MKRRSAKAGTTWTSAAAQRLLTLAGEPGSVDKAVVVVTKNVLQGIGSPPTDLEALCRRLNVTSVRAEEIPISAELRRATDGYEIVYSSFLSRERRRFTIAHELGHVIFEGTGRNPPRAGRELERLCDMLATEILMPRDIFLSVAGANPSLREVFELARLFGASLSATAIRSCELGIGSVLEVERGRRVWSWGRIRTITEEMTQAIDDAQQGQWASCEIGIVDRGIRRRWHLEAAPIGQGDRALLYVRPLPTSRSDSKLPRANVTRSE